eukprot:7629127-Pyramimonas_sp.AAC.1
MDQCTWDSIPETCRSLLGRVGVVVTDSMPGSTMQSVGNEDSVSASSVEEAVMELSLREDAGDIH